MYIRWTCCSFMSSQWLRWSNSVWSFFFWFSHWLHYHYVSPRDSSTCDLSLPMHSINSKTCILSLFESGELVARSCLRSDSAGPTYLYHLPFRFWMRSLHTWDFLSALKVFVILVSFLFEWKGDPVIGVCAWSPLTRLVHFIFILLF
jgi:hypothetical protein